MEFSRKYHEASFPERCAGKHGENLRRCLNDRRDQHLLQRCLAQTGPNGSLADVGCGPGRFWPVLERWGGQALCALDVSHAMLRFARERHAAGARGPVRLVAGSALAEDFDAAGLVLVVVHFDLLPGYSQWRYYVLRPAALGIAPS